MKKEVEVRSFISKEEYFRLKVFLNDNADFLEKRNETTYYLNSKKDLRIQKTDSEAKIWLKEGKIHDDFREELEVRTYLNDFDNLKKLFKSLGMKTVLKWERERLLYQWNDIKCALDKTKNYGYIIELEKMVEKGEKETYEELKEKLRELEVELTPKEEFEKKYKEYRQKYLQK